uniref:mRNA-degrading endonuclease (mRNA interferase) YafQ, toxin component of the YafQ-DinJ toxin-antitoxin module n=1 Tax=Candidatus Kentrum sp. UNK TaxID=2126344 RepID=A0A451AVS9_9GAMM|nr:MAG: mRNA-degrading endonuclease (mRNA interferase) YafQ, toxin component of the YafQ-DinJ toxin-antitoxin module [Candidatus Kentron sp. UNK]VFK70135.1 MAG: mRNA-degrading endonuclease (mRNA interferase) YafQ, toxin component of the YafQ-DinJ toxin-antitoxin module [Candidatus Kentron sp. UNK]
MMRIEQKPSFQRVYKKLHARQRTDVDGAIRTLMEDPKLGEGKVGDLAGVRVYKFKMNKQLALLAYTFEETTITLTLLALGQHENFYRGLKKSL